MFNCVPNLEGNVVSMGGISKLVSGAASQRQFDKG